MPRTRVRSRILPLPFEGAWAPCRAFSHRTCARGAPRVEFLDAMPARSRERAGGRAHAGPWSVHVVGIYMYPCYTHVCSVAVLGTRRGVDQRRECRARASCAVRPYPIWNHTLTHLYNEYTGGRAGGCVYRQCGADIQDRSAERQKSQVTNTHLHTRRPAPGHMSGPGPRTADRTPVGPGRIHVRFEMIQGNVAHVRCGIHMWYKSCSLSFLVFFCVTAVYIYFPVSPG